MSHKQKAKANIYSFKSESIEESLKKTGISLADLKSVNLNNKTPEEIMEILSLSLSPCYFSEKKKHGNRW